MRQLVIALLAGVVTTASAGPRAPKPQLRASDKPVAIDTKAVIDKLDLFRDDVGNYYVSPRADAGIPAEDADQWVFYGDGKAFYRQWIIGSSSSGGVFEWNVWSPRAKGLVTATLDLSNGNLTARCRPKEVRQLTLLKADEARTIFRAAKFYPPLWQRQSHLLARDDDGVYYFIDELREEYGGAGFRVFVGPKGAMKELAMTNMASDSAGEIFATKGGQLKIVTGAEGKATWSKGGKKTELTVLPPSDNKYLIYRELGIYGKLGVVCDDL
jgi:hypothetical protein